MSRRPADLLTPVSVAGSVSRYCVPVLCEHFDNMSRLSMYSYVAVVGDIATP